MIPNNVPPPGDPQRTLRHVCESCSTPLLLPASKAGTSGPCPKCGQWIDASKFVSPAIRPPRVIVPHLSLAGKPPARKRAAGITSGKGSVRADGYLDHEYNERREMFGTLRVLAVFAVVGAVILFVFLYMRQWMMK